MDKNLTYKQDITAELLKDCSPYIGCMKYDITLRELTIECLDNPKDQNPKRTLKFSDIVKYSEESLDDNSDDALLDSNIGMNWMDNNILCVHTQKKVIILELNGSPESFDK